MTHFWLTWVGISKSKFIFDYIHYINPKQYLMNIRSDTYNYLNMRIIVQYKKNTSKLYGTLSIKDAVKLLTN